MDRKKTALVLGSTGSLRVLATKHFEKTYVADFSRTMFEAESARVPEKSRQSEIFVNSNWLELAREFPESYFDYVMGDIVIRQFRKDEIPGFLQIIRHLLRPGGLFVTRNYHFNPQWESTPLSSILFDDFAAFEKGDHGIVFQTRLRIYDKYRGATRSGIISDLKALMQIVWTVSRHYNGRTDFFLRRVLSNDFVIFGPAFTALTQADFDALARKYFACRGKFHSPRSLDHEFYPIEILEKIDVDNVN